MAAQTFAQLRTRLDTWLHDPNDSVFTSAEKDEFLTTTFDDPFIYKFARDTSLTTTLNGYRYAVPTGFLGITDVYVDQAGDGFGDRLDSSAWSEVDGYLYISHKDKGIPTGCPIILYGRKVLDSATDSVPNFLQNYILHLAMIEAYSMIINLLTVRFVKNDITMAEAIQAKNSHEVKAAQLRANLANKSSIEW